MSALLCVLSPTLGRIKNLTPEISHETKAKAELTNQILFLLQTARRKCLSLVFLAPPQFLCQAYFQPLSNLFCALQPKWMVAGEVLWEGGAGQSCLSLSYNPNIIFIFISFSLLQFKQNLYIHFSFSYRSVPSSPGEGATGEDCQPKVQTSSPTSLILETGFWILDP